MGGNTWVVFDGNYMVHRAFFTFENLAYEGQGTGAIFGFLREVMEIQDLFAGSPIFCFDHGKLLREKKVPTYKEARRKKAESATREEKILMESRHTQRELLKTEILKAVGWNNVFYQDGYEADDMIAAFCTSQEVADDEKVIVSSDRDFYQLLNVATCLYNPLFKKTYTWDCFKKDYYGLSPYQWADVKAIAGCDSDGVIGLKGVGEKKAAQYLASKMNPETETYKRINSGEASRMRMKNLELVRLPYPGVAPLQIQADTMTPGKWQKVCRKYGMSSLLS